MKQNPKPVAPKHKLNQVIAERELRLAMKGRKRQKVHVRFGKPRRLPDGRDYTCVYQIEGLHDYRITRRMAGLDSIQALELAMKMAMVELVCSGAYAEGRLSWEGMYDLGLPVVESIRDRIKKDPKAERIAKKVDTELEERRLRPRPRPRGRVTDRKRSRR